MEGDEDPGGAELWDPDDAAPTQALTQGVRVRGSDGGYDPDDQPTQAFTQGYSHTQALDSQEYQPTQALSRSGDTMDDDDNEPATQAFHTDVEERKSVHDSEDEDFLLDSISESGEESNTSPRMCSLSSSTVSSRDSSSSRFSSPERDPWFQSTY